MNKLTPKHESYVIQRSGQACMFPNIEENLYGTRGLECKLKDLLNMSYIKGICMININSIVFLPPGVQEPLLSACVCTL